MATLENRMEVSALHAGADATAQSTAYVLLGNMNLLKVADQNPWVDGDLGYTVTLKNVEDTGDITDITFTDIIDITKSKLLTDSVKIDGEPAVLGVDYQYNALTGQMDIEYDGDLTPGSTATITFQVRKV